MAGIPYIITFIVTEECQLACKYCYLPGKNSKNKMTFDTAKKAIDLLFNEKILYNEKPVNLEFIGGEPFLEIDLIDQICDYFTLTAFILDHQWFNEYSFNFTTNGLLYNNEKVQKFINKNFNHVNITLSIDGTENKHNINRVYPNGKGSYNDVIKSIPNWLKQFPNASTKVTISSDDVPYIFESLVHLINLGIKKIDINCVYENVWKEGDELLYEEQLFKLADYFIKNDLFNKVNCSFFSEFIGRPLNDNKNWCGSGDNMMAIDYKGDFYPCNRFTEMSLNKKKPRIIGNIVNGIDYNKLRPFKSLDWITQSPNECINCEFATGCSWCQGWNYDEAESDTIFKRAIYVCKMHKARVKANNYFQQKIKSLVNV